MIAVHFVLSWWETTINYSVSHLFGVYAGSYALSFVKFADVIAALIILPLVLKIPCLESETCEIYTGFVMSALLIVGSIISCFLNPYPLVVEPTDAFEWPTEKSTIVSKHLLVEF